MTAPDIPTYRFPFDEDDGSVVFRTIISLADTREFQVGEKVTRQYWHADEFYLLQDGKVEFSIRLDEAGVELPVGTTDIPWTPMGWSGLRWPHRYATSITCVQPCTFYVWRRVDIERFLSEQPGFGARFLYIAQQASVYLLRQTLDMVKLSPWHMNFLPAKPAADSMIALQPEPEETLSLLLRSPFFEVFPAAMLNQLSRVCEVREIPPGGCLFAQGDRAASLLVLGDGKIELYYDSPPDQVVEEGRNKVFFRTLGNPGQVISWSSTLDGKHGATAVAVSRSRVYGFPQSEIDRLAKQDPQFALLMAQRLLWLVGNHLRTARVRLVGSAAAQEQVAIRSLIDQARPQLSVNSALHKVPHLLDNRLTLEDGYRCLQQVLEQGTSLEKSLASLCLDLLREVKREGEIYQSLRGAYESVVNAPAELPAREVRWRCNQAFRRVFGFCDYRIIGEKHLPAEPGHIFILNHLLNHPFNTLPNQFHLTLDCHFVCSMVLSPKYQDTAIRVVRQSRGDEYGHQDYYNRLGHIYVRTRDSDPDPSQQRRRDSTELFYQAAAEHLGNGRNLIICPEGVSHRIQDSPGEFKPGAFRLAGKLQPEPLIVPIAVAGFDQRLNHATLVAVVHEPFRVSDLFTVGDSEEMGRFLHRLRDRYRAWIQEAVALSEQSM